MISKLRIILVALVFCQFLAAPVAAQTQAETLEDVRLEIMALSEVMQNLRSVLT